MFALKLTEKLLIQGFSMTYASKHTDSAVEFKNTPPQPSSRDRYLRIPDPLSNQIRITKKLGVSGSFEPIRSDSTTPQPTSHTSTVPLVDSKKQPKHPTFSTSFQFSNIETVLNSSTNPNK